MCRQRRYAPRLPGNIKLVFRCSCIWASNRRFTIIETKPEIAGDNDTTPDVLPAPVNTLLATLWVCLFGGRWLLVPMVQAAGLLSPEQTADWDEGILAKVYLILLSITCVVLALRAVRHLQSHNGVAQAASPAGSDAHTPLDESQ